MPLIALGLVTAVVGCDAKTSVSANSTGAVNAPATTRPAATGQDLTEWSRERTEAAAKKLSELAYYVTQKDGTERAGTSELLDIKKPGVYACAVCELPLFASETKFDSGTGWPSFYQPINEDYVLDVEDNSLGMTRTENECARCRSHLGHVFTDGPKPTGLRYCMNGVSLKFIPDDQPTTQAAE